MKTIVYKIVVAEERCSSFATGKYRIYYHKGTIVKAFPGTLGIMAFRSETYVSKFLKDMGFRPEGFEVIRLEAKNVRTYPIAIELAAQQNEYDLDQFYKSTKPRVACIKAPAGTVFCDKALVMD